LLLGLIISTLVICFFTYMWSSVLWNYNKLMFVHIVTRWSMVIYIRNVILYNSFE
jgi:hypothetical protein